mmetsp:Transcript_25307/g.57793  ORF Transcript_25307/g.57793 Transcript_25307/m.57793 type:complete len:258 (-) Transcript_25307:320-1093(-)
MRLARSSQSFLAAPALSAISSSRSGCRARSSCRSVSAASSVRDDRDAMACATASRAAFSDRTRFRFRSSFAATRISRSAPSLHTSRSASASSSLVASPSSRVTSSGKPSASKASNGPANLAGDLMGESPPSTLAGPANGSKGPADLVGEAMMVGESGRPGCSAASAVSIPMPCLRSLSFLLERTRVWSRKMTSPLSCRRCASLKRVSMKVASVRAFSTLRTRVSCVISHLRYIPIICVKAVSILEISAASSSRTSRG